MTTKSNLPMVAHVTIERMKLRPVDFSLLAELENGRNVASNLHIEIDASHQYVNKRLTQLDDYGLIQRIGPNERSGLYEITPGGEWALEKRKLYKEDPDRFEDLYSQRSQ